MRDFAFESGFVLVVEVKLKTLEIAHKIKFLTMLFVMFLERQLHSCGLVGSG